MSLSSMGAETTLKAGVEELEADIGAGGQGIPSAASR
jgi:hypothetical protein